VIVSVASARRYLLTTLFLLITGGMLMHARSSSVKQESNAQPARQNSQNAQSQEDPLKRPLPKKKKNSNKSEEAYKRWRDDVRWIITPEEEQAFKKLATDEERDQFIEIFWLHRDPTPDTPENEYKDEYYRRVAYANEHFGAGVPGRNTDRGHIYILHGKPDSIDAHPAGGPYQRMAEEGGGQTITYPFEIWRYRHLEGIGQEIEFEFVDTCSCGDYHITLDRGEKDAGTHVPGVGPTDSELMGRSTKADRLRGGIETLGPSLFDNNRESKEFDRMSALARAMAPPSYEFKGLKEAIDHNIRYNLLPFDVQVDFVKVASDTVLTPITIQVANRDLTYISKDGVQRASLNIFGRLTTLTGQLAQTFEEPLRLEQPAELLSKFVNNTSIYQKALPLRPGRYRLDIALKDVNGDKLGTFAKSILVPDFSSNDKLTSSTLIIADVMEMMPAVDVGTGSFVIGTERVRPRVGAANGKPATFKRNQKVNLWMQVYNLAVDEKTRKPSATVVYEIRDIATNKPVMYLTETTEQMGNVDGQVTLEKSLLPNQLTPGVYQVTIKVNDLVSKQTISPTTKFAVE
jgi:GWxTD domain-containing protein